METPPPPASDEGEQQESLPPPSLSPKPLDAPPPPSSPAAQPDIPGGAGMPGAGAPPPSPPPPPAPPAAQPPYQPYPPAAPAATPPTAPPDPSTLYGAAPPPPYPPAPPYGGYGAPGYGQPGPTDGPAPGLRYAGFGIRTAAYLIDAVILFIVALIVSPALGGITTTSNTIIGNELVQSSSVNSAYLLFQILLGAIYFIGFWSLTSRTPGMMLLHLRVLRASDGKPISIGLGVVRYIGLLISFWVIFIGVIWVAIDARRQGWHDKMAGTFVVQEVGQQGWSG